ncbi:hypothetical protein [Alicyclobacillus ferrooxydans]|uniref:hypothetical protein n=1 Tax=Alicyclobacillus ferrooxydans TaxID=471514 RepID=UPI000B113C1E|nr:hypothetical protein [Alicyclobacillus ferrooxydans]
MGDPPLLITEGDVYGKATRINCQRVRANCRYWGGRRDINCTATVFKVLLGIKPGGH